MHALFSIISQTFTAERRALQWRENEFCLHLQSGKWRIEIHVKLEMCGVPQKKNKSCSIGLDVCVASARVSSPILILNLCLLKVQPGRQLSREPFIQAVRI